MLVEPLIPPFLVGNQLVTDFLVKENLFNNYFSKQGTTVDNDSCIPPNITFPTDQKLSTLNSVQMILSRLLNRWIQTRCMDTIKYIFE